MARAFAVILLFCGAVQSQGVHQLYYFQKDNPTQPITYAVDKIVDFSPSPAKLPVNGSRVHPDEPTCVVAPPVCSKSRYRSFNGSCNNIQRPTWGMPQTPYGRLLSFNYEDGISAWPVSSTGQPLPNARTISLTLFPEKDLADPVWNLNLQQWGQFMAHDMSLAIGSTLNQCQRKEIECLSEPIKCCNDKGQLAPDAATNPQCKPIMVPPLDPVHSPYGSQCLQFVRTMTTRDRGCAAPDAPAAPLSAVTAYMDLSQVYGNSVGQASSLREHCGGRMLTVRRGGREWPPQDPDYKLGDIRMNQNPQLTVLQIIMLREHNRIADALAALNPHWDDETVFQEARRIAIAEYQYINYYEYLPILLGTENMIKNKLIHTGGGYVNDYDDSVAPAVLVEHATAASRHFHTLIRGYLQLISEKRQVLGAVRISDWFNRPLLHEIGTTFEDLARGLTTQPMEFSDQFVTSEVTQYLFKGNNTVGGDLRAIDVQRGRDHGLAGYIAARGACGLSVPKTFAEMTDYIAPENVRVIEQLYPILKDVELVVAGSLERTVPGAQAGPTFLCIITEQFYRTRVGDRFFFENGADPETAFTQNQLEAIRSGASMARLLCDNVDDINIMQPKAFELINSENHLMPCDHLPTIDLSFWKDAGSLK